MAVRKGPGRPPNRTDFEPKVLDAARAALRQAARHLDLPHTSYLADDGSGPRQRAPRALDAAVLAITLSEALEVVANEQVHKARNHDGVTWEQVGEAFDIGMQSAHARFRHPLS